MYSGTQSHSVRAGVAAQTGAPAPSSVTCNWKLAAGAGATATRAPLAAVEGLLEGCARPRLEQQQPIARPQRPVAADFAQAPTGELLPPRHCIVARIDRRRAAGIQGTGGGQHRRAIALAFAALPLAQRRDGAFEAIRRFCRQGQRCRDHQRELPHDALFRGDDEARPPDRHPRTRRPGRGAPQSPSPAPIPGHGRAGCPDCRETARRSGRARPGAIPGPLSSTTIRGPGSKAQQHAIAGVGEFEGIVEQIGDRPGSSPSARPASSPLA